MKATIVILIIFSSLFSFAKADKFNTYRFNRINYEKKNSKVDTSYWFEWWYYKVVLPESGESYYFVYGAVNPWDENQSLPASRSYVGFGDFKQKTIVEEHYPVSSFWASYITPHVEIAQSKATHNNIQGDIYDKHGERYQWNIDIKKLWSFNATSWMTGRQITNIEWYPAQADAHCSGQILSKGRLIKFENAPCYQDRNWGNSFPKWWTWIVSNYFKNSPGTALAIGGGKPKINGKFTPIQGVTIGLRYKGKDYAFRPSNLNSVSSKIKFGKWEVQATNGQYKIKVSAWAPRDQFMDLQFVTPQNQTFHDYETLTGRLKVWLYKKVRHHNKKVKTIKWKLVDFLTSDFAGIEYGSFKEY